MDSQEYPYKNFNYPSALVDQSSPLLDDLQGHIYDVPLERQVRDSNLPSPAAYSAAAAIVNAQAARIIAEIQADREEQIVDIPALQVLPQLSHFPPQAVAAPAPAQLPAAAATPPNEQKTTSTAVTPEQLQALRHHYHERYDRNANNGDRATERERVARIVGVTARVVSAKYTQFHRQARKAAQRAERARANTQG